MRLPRRRRGHGVGKGGHACENVEALHPAQLIVEGATYERLSGQADDVFLLDVLRTVAHDRRPNTSRERLAIEDVYREPVYWHLAEQQLISTTP